MKRILTASLDVAWALLWLPLWMFFLHPFWRRREGRAPWVIGGHRGRLYADNAAAVEAAARASGQDIIWIARKPLAKQLRSQGIYALNRHSFAARRAISEAPVLIYSHGEDDLDLFLLLFRGRVGLRVYLNHCLNLLKAGGVLDPGFERMIGFLRPLKTWLITDCDAFLCASEMEKQAFVRSYPMHAGKIQLGGGAHLDQWTSEEPKKQIYWFPTFRESALSKQMLSDATSELLKNQPLRDWLNAKNYRFLVGSHINSGESRKLSPPFFQGDLSKLVDDVRQSQVLISDYSGMLFNFLFLQRAPLFFAFDLEEYQKGRVLYEAYDSLSFGLHARTTQELVDHITSERFLAPELAQKAQEVRSHYFESEPLVGEFAQNCVKTIHALEKNRRQRNDQVAGQDQSGGQDQVASD